MFNLSAQEECGYRRIYDTSSNDNSSTTTLRLKFLSNGHFVETPLRRTQLCRMRHLVEISPLVSDAKINLGYCLCHGLWKLSEIIVQTRIIPSG